MRIRDMIGTMVPKKKGETVQLYSEWGLHVLGAREDKDYVPLPEYPRPQFVRENYKNLNGWWDYRIAPASLWDKPGEFFSGEMDGKILVPFSPETELSGVGRILQPDEVLWYQRAVNVPVKKDGRLLLHFGAVDQSCLVYWNTRKVGAHLGGYLPFTLEITDCLKTGENVLAVAVRDDTDGLPFARGKQRIEHGGMYYKPMSGIWQTVWLETVPSSYIVRVDAEDDGTARMADGTHAAGEGPGAENTAAVRFRIRTEGCACRGRITVYAPGLYNEERASAGGYCTWIEEECGCCPS